MVQNQHLPSKISPKGSPTPQWAQYGCFMAKKTSRKAIHRVTARDGAATQLTFNAFQHLIRDRYYATDSARGTPGTFLWFIEELGELATALQDNAPDKKPTKAQRANLLEEFADVLAWLTTLANINNVNLEEALKKYTLKGVEGVKD